MDNLKEPELVALYTSFKDDARGWLALHRQHFTQFVAIILAILGASITAFIKLIDEDNELWIVIIGPILSIPLSFFAMFVCNKFYRRYSEHDAISFKLFRLLESRTGLNKELKAINQLFAEDDLFPERWLKRLDNAIPIDRYADEHVRTYKASNFFIKCTFWGLIAASLALIVVFIKYA